MARPLRVLIPDAFYHVTCRGNERKSIFRDDTDRSAFIDKLKASREIYHVEIHAYVLMPNHFHLIVKTLKANLSEFMRHFNISYTVAFNRRHNRVGHLYQGRYKAILVDQDSYLLELSRYVHLNPVRIRSNRALDIHQQIRVVDNFTWSSLRGYLHSASKLPWINYDAVLGYVGGNRKRYGEFLAQGVRSGYDTPWEKLRGQLVLGEETFVERVKSEISGRGSKREQPAVRHFEAKDLQAVLQAIARHFGVTAEKITRKRTRYRTERAVAMELIYRYCGVGQAEIGRALGNLDYSAVSRERKWLRDKVQHEKSLRAQIDTIAASLIS